MGKMASVFAGCLLGAVAMGAEVNDPAVAEECRVRAGLPNVLARLEAGGNVSIAYLGGSITAAGNGWRSQTLAWFRTRFPRACIHEINAAISGTGSDYGAIRLSGDVLKERPDLLFVEFRVNGSAGFDYPSVEGILRQTWAANPETDICLVYTICESMVEGSRRGRQTPFGTAMETIANHYGVPSVDLGIEVVKRLDAGSLVFRSDRPVAGKLAFSRDGVHPGTEGHALYRDVIARSLEKMFRSGAKPGAHRTPPPLRPNPWEKAVLVPPEKFLPLDVWQPVDEAADSVFRSDLGRTKAMLRGGRWTDREGASFSIAWTGTTVGLSDIPQDLAMRIEASVDGGKPIAFTRLRTREPRLHARFYYLPAQPHGHHVATFTVKTIPAGQRFFCGQALVVGSLDTP
ncbi:MAG: SGNH/GDSL hydrolase family protein [Kiritimatiellia bacterium]